MSEAILTAKNLKRHYEVKGGFLKPDATVRALDGASFTLTPGKTLAVVGELGVGQIDAGPRRDHDRAADRGRSDHRRAQDRP